MSNKVSSSLQSLLKRGSTVFQRRRDQGWVQYILLQYIESFEMMQITV